MTSEVTLNHFNLNNRSIDRSVEFSTWSEKFHAHWMFRPKHSKWLSVIMKEGDNIVFLAGQTLRLFVVKTYWKETILGEYSILMFFDLRPKKNRMSSILNNLYLNVSNKGKKRCHELYRLRPRKLSGAYWEWKIVSRISFSITMLVYHVEWLLYLSTPST